MAGYAEVNIGSKFAQELSQFIPTVLVVLLLSQWLWMGRLYWPPYLL